MANYITIDGGTTNTRLSLVMNGSVTTTLKYPIGARASIDGVEPLKKAIGEGISRLLADVALTEEDIECVIASGMITCEYGLCELAHLTAPAGIKDLADGMVMKQFPDISPLPFYFIRGVKTTGDLLSADMMRGEETELVGIMGDEPAGTYILPGSHSKIVKVDGDGRIIDFCTTLTGEMIHALSTETILKSTVDLDSKLCKEALFEGFDIATSIGLNAALFKVRTMKNLFYRSSAEAYSFFLGAVLSEEMSIVTKRNPERVVIGGKRQLREASALLLDKLVSCPVIPLSDKAVESSTTIGAIRIYEFRKSFTK